MPHAARYASKQTKASQICTIYIECFGCCPVLSKITCFYFQDDKSAGVDPRFLEVWLKYASMSVNPLDVYRFMYSNGMCTLQAGLYDAWAWYLETQNNYKAAEAVYCKGVDALTDREAKEGLASRKAQFETRVCRRMKGEEITAEEIEEQEQRSALGRLRAQGKQGSVGSVRVGSAKLGGPGVIQALPAKQPLKPNNGKVFKIFQDENGAPAAAGNQRSADPGHHKLPGKEDYKENQMSAGKWTGSTGPKAANIPLNKISKHVKAAFSVHEDHESGRSTITPHKLVPGESNVLSARKLYKDDAMVHCPVALFEPPDPTKNPMYCKNKVYQGATEFSFEEMRAMKWKAKEKIRLENLEIERKRLEILEMERNLKERQEEMVRQMEEFKRMMEMKSQAPPSLKVTKPSEIDLSSTPDSTLSVDGRSADNSYKKSTMDDTTGLINANPSGVRTRYFSAVTPSPHGHKLPNTHPSPTVNTKEALAVMQQLWSNSAVNDSVFSNSAPAAQEAKFEIFSDSSAPAPAAGFEIYTDPTEQVPCGSVPTVPAAPFQIFSDDSGKENAIVNNARKSKSSKGLVFNLDDKENMIVMSENDENLPPPNYIQPKVARAKSGILTPAENVEWMPLEEQERLLDEDERRQEEALSLPKPNIGNATMFIPDECEFDKMAKMSSTPFTGRSFVPFDDENTCAVELVYRDPRVEDRQVMPPPPVFEPPPPSVPEPAPALFDPPPVFEEPPSTPLSPIVETSREHYRSSSSSSGTDTLHCTTRGEHSKSHWGNTVTGNHHGTADTTGLGYSLGSRTPGNGLVSACGSGYIGDKSSMSSVRRETKQPLGVRTEDIKATAEEFGKRMEIAYSSQDDDQTGMFSDMLAEFKQTLEKPPTVAVQDHMERSLHPSFIETRDRLEMVEQSLSHHNFSVFHGAEPRPGGVHESIIKSPILNSTAAGFVPGLHGLDMTAGPELSAPGVGRGSFMSSAPGLNITGALDRTSAHATAVAPVTLNMTKPTLDMTKPTLDMTKTMLDMTKPMLDMTKPMLDMTEPKLEISTELNNHDLQYQQENLDVVPHVENSSDMLDINPFSPETQEQLLAKVSVPVYRRHGFVPVDRKLPPISVKSRLQLGEDIFLLKALKGEGGFARVYSAVREDTGLDCTIAGIDAVLKVMSQLFK